ncbi:hypothetical protein EMIT019CA3_30003 [Bacillus pseudomycoides]|nr:hypothetical protein bmyco0003_52350 [Bacillus pseudomycoides]KFN10252.1 hypothetical protein DJ94_5483 [Bacillus pseudomycoides]
MNVNFLLFVYIRFFDFIDHIVIYSFFLKPRIKVYIQFFDIVIFFE